MSVLLDGTNGFHALQSTLIAPPFTFAAWCRTTSTASSGALIALTNSLDTGNFFFIGRTTTRAYAIASGSTTAQAQTATGVFSTANWRVIVGVFAGDSSRIIDTNSVAPVSNFTAVTVSSINRLCIGVRAGSANGSFWRGHIANVAIWNVALSTAECNMIGCSDVSEFGFEPTMVRPGNLLWYFPIYSNAAPIKKAGSGPALSWTTIGAPVNGEAYTTGAAPRFYAARSGLMLPEPPAAAGFNAAWSGATTTIGAGVAA